MKLSFYGDSWFWTWFPKGQNALTNTELKKLKGISVAWSTKHDIKQGDNFINGYDILTPILNSMGHDVSNYCNPGNSFKDSVTEIVEGHQKDQYQKVSSDAIIVYVSTVIRHSNLEKFLRKPWKDIKTEYNELMYQELQRLGDYALERKQKIYLFAGQTTLKQKVFDNAFNPNDPRKNYLYLASECIVTDLHNKLNHANPVKTPGLFKLTTWDGPNRLEKYQSDTINNLHNHIKTFEQPEYQQWMWPDTGHLNFNGQIHFLNLLFDKIQQYKYVL